MHFRAMAPTLSVFINISIWSLYILLLCSGVFTHGSRSTAAERWPPFAVFCQPFLRCRNMLVHSQCSWGHTAHVCGRHSKQTGTLQCYQRSSLSCKALCVHFSVTQEFFIKSVCLTRQQMAVLSELKITRARKTILVKHSRGR